MKKRVKSLKSKVKSRGRPVCIALVRVCPGRTATTEHTEYTEKIKLEREESWPSFAKASARFPKNVKLERNGKNRKGNKE